MFELRAEAAATPVCILTCTGAGAPEMLAEAPSFTWRVVGKYGCQRAWRLTVSEAGGDAPLWDSGWVEDDRAVQVAYGGPPLVSNRDYTATVTVRADDGEEIPCAAPVRFSTGFFRPEEEWTAQWLSAATATEAPPLFRRAFSLKGPVVRARLFLCGLGYHEAWLNGKKLGDRVLDPSWTDFNTRVCYVAHDVTGLLAAENVLGVLLGNGWYSSDFACPRPVFTARLLVEYQDGGEFVLESAGGGGWKVNSSGPLRECSLYIGEVYDARRELTSWMEPDYLPRPEDGWGDAITAEPPAGRLVPMIEEPIRTVAQLAPVSLTPLGGGAVVVDFGQNTAGVVRLAMSCPAGTEVGLRYAELLYPDGRLNTENLRSAQQADRYIARGDGEVYQPRFTYHGFRYAEVTGLPDLKPEDIRLVALRNDVPVRGRFECANPLLNDIQRICQWTESSNMHSVPTDCPQRDERLGWLNDLTVRAEEAVCNFDLSRFYRKFLQDIADAQGPVTGAITDTVPYRHYGGQPADPVCSSYLILPWLLYLHHGDKASLARHYDGLAAWTNYLAGQREDGVVRYSFYGDWAAPIAGNDAASYGSGAVSAITPGKLVSTGFLCMNARLMARIAGVLGKTGDVPRYEKLAEEAKEALNRTWLDGEKGSYATGSQAANAFMLYLDVVPPARKDAVLQSLIADIRAHGTHLTTGNLCSRYILDALADNGQVNLAYELATQTTYPSWGYMLEKGATTTWERWEYVDGGPLIGMASHSHPMYSTISGWFYTRLLGLQPLEDGFARFAFAPKIPAELPSASGLMKTVRGDIEAGWSQTVDGLRMTVTVPFGSRCRAVLPLGASATLNGGPAASKTENGAAWLDLPPGRHEILNRR